jgi:hypothetical protein
MKIVDDRKKAAHVGRKRLHRAVVHFHARRDRDVDVRCEHCFRQVVGDVLRNVEGTGLGAVVADSHRLGADAERRHQPVEEPVVVVRGEDDNELWVVRAHELAGYVQRRVDVVKQILRRSRKIQ